MPGRASPRSRQQRGVALIVLLALVSFVLIGALLSFAGGTDDSIERSKRTEAALAQAKLALIDYAASVYLGSPCAAPGNNCPRPGDLPCPDLNNSGTADAVPACDATVRRIGRLPWRTLGLPDLRDGYGERLWYAVSANFKNNTRTVCTAVANTGCLNSDTPGTITIRDNRGNVLYDAGAAPSTGVVAVVFAPGAALTREGAAAAQDRSCLRGGVADPLCDPTVGGNYTCSGTGAGTPPDYFQTALCNPQNYLDTVDASVIAGLPATQDNARLFEPILPNGNGFISGPIVDGSGNTIVNDRFVLITVAEIRPAIEQRVAREVLGCLKQYAAASGGRYPWTAKPDDYTDFADQSGTRFGRVPDSFINTNADNALMPLNWPSGCNISPGSGWWLNWKELVFMAVAQGFDPSVGVVGCGTCLSINPPAFSNKGVAVIVAGHALTGQAHGPASFPTEPLSNYLEGGNVAGASPLTQSAATSSFDDVTVFR
jgi:type II secretory pathway pseudopilin PulG